MFSLDGESNSVASIVTFLKAEIPDAVFYDGMVDEVKKLKPVILVEALKGFRMQGLSLSDLIVNFGSKESTMGTSTIDTSLDPLADTAHVGLLLVDAPQKTPQVELKEAHGAIIVLAPHPSVDGSLFFYRVF